jgi:hypothetical protein
MSRLAARLSTGQPLCPHHKQLQRCLAHRFIRQQLQDRGSCCPLPRQLCPDSCSSDGLVQQLLLATAAISQSQQDAQCLLRLMRPQQSSCSSGYIIHSQAAACRHNTTPSRPVPASYTMVNQELSAQHTSRCILSVTIYACCSADVHGADTGVLHVCEAPNPLIAHPHAHARAGAAVALLDRWGPTCVRMPAVAAQTAAAGRRPLAVCQMPLVGHCCCCCCCWWW